MKSTILMILTIFFICLDEHAFTQSTVSYVMQDANFTTQFNDGGDFFNNGGTELAMWANTGNKNTVAWRTFKTAGDGSGSDRALQVGDVIIITVSATRAFGQIGFSLNSDGTQGTSYNNRTNGSRLYFNTDNYAAWYVNRNGGNTSLSYVPQQNTYKDYIFTIKITSNSTADVYLKVDGVDYRAYNLTMNGTGNINAFSIYGSDLWDGDSNDNAYWKQTCSVTNSKSVELGYFLSTGNYSPGIISDGLEANSTSSSSINAVFIGGNSGSTVTLDQTNLYSGATTINPNATAIISNSNAFGVVDGGVIVSNGGRIQLSGSISIGNESLTLNGVGIEHSGALMNINGINVWGGAITINADARINSNTGTQLTLTSGVSSASTTSYFGGEGTISISGAFTGTKITENGAIFKDGIGTLQLIANNEGLTGNVIVNNGILQIGNGGTTGSVVGNITNNASLIINRSNAFTYSGVISGTGSLTKSGDGNLILTEVNTYSGATSISSGSIELTGSLPNSDLSVANGATLLINGTDVTLKSLTVAAGGTVEIQPGKALTITNALANSGTLRINSDASGTGSLIHNSNAITATVERYIPGVSYAWHLVGSPVDAQGISGDWITGNYDFYAYDEATATWLNQKVGVNNLTLFTPGKGYLVAYATTAQTKLFSGTMNNGDVTIAVTNAGTGSYTGANLLSNPYTSGLDWNTATRTLFADNFAYVYNQTANGGAGAFTTIDGGENDAWVAPHQGFFVVAQTAGNFTFKNDMRGHGGTYTKNVAADEEGLTLRLSGVTYFDITSIRLKDGTSALRDRDDALKFFSYTADAPQLYSLSEDGTKLSLNSHAQISQESAISLGTTTPVEGTYSLSIDALSGQFSDKTLYLEDKLLNINHNLTTNGAYSFIGTPTDDPNRFLLHFGAVGVNEKPEISQLKAWVVADQLYFNLNGQALLEVVDLQGRVLEQTKVSGSGLSNHALNLPAGAYLVRLLENERVQTAKVIVK